MKNQLTLAANELVGIDLGREPVPDERTVVRFRHVLEGKRDPEMHQTRKGNEWHSGMKAHIGVDSQSKSIHSVTATPANTADSKVLRPQP